MLLKPALELHINIAVMLSMGLWSPSGNLGVCREEKSHLRQCNDLSPLAQKHHHLSLWRILSINGEKKWAYFQAKIKLGPHCMEMMGLREKRNETKPRKYIYSGVAGGDSPGALGVTCSSMPSTWQHMASCQWMNEQMDGWMDGQMDEQMWDPYISKGLVSITLFSFSFV